ncbi:MAG TPA: DsbA family oxidoreductase [Ktedonobacteraceae bacterium]|jgi:predicted DsbA family dithiol-disulfide isomerase
MQKMQVEIWSDVACPWCYIGKRRFETALAEFKHRDQVEVIWRSYQLDPEAPRTSDIKVSEIVAKKYGISTEQAMEANARITEMGAQEGIEYHFEKTLFGNTFNAHRLIHLGAKHNLQGAVKERLMKAYFTEGAAIGDTELLVKVVSEVGIDADEVRAVLDSDTYADEVRADVQRARLFGIQGVPFFAIDETYGISGAQPLEVFREVLVKAWAESHPLINISAASQNAGMCDDGSCSI